MWFLVLEVERIFLFSKIVRFTYVSQNELLIMIFMNNDTARNGITRIGLSLRTS
jgi:hypothetical protein